MPSDRELEALRQAFGAFDKDGSGTIDAAELKECLKAMGMHPNPLELEELLKQMDTDGESLGIGFEGKIFLESNIAKPHTATVLPQR